MLKECPIITLITLTYNQLENATKPFIESLYKYTPVYLFKLIIIDNHSTDGTVEYLHELEKEKNNIVVKYNEKNLGYSKGNNIGLKMADTQYVGLLNNDILLSPNWLKQTLKIYEYDPKAGLVAPQMLMSGQKCDNFLYAKRSNYLKKIDVYRSNAKEIFTLKFSPQFSCVLMPKELIYTVGYLDENFSPAFYEDVDYMSRVWMAGYKCYISNYSFFFHNHCQTSSNLKERKKIMEKNREYFREKNFMASELERLYVENNQLRYHVGQYSYKNIILNTMKRILKKV